MLDPSHVAGGPALLGGGGDCASHGLARKGTMGRAVAEPVDESRASAAKRVRTGSVRPSIMRSLAESGLAPSFERHEVSSDACMNVPTQGFGEGLASLAENPPRASLEPTPGDDITQDQASGRAFADAPHPSPHDSHDQSEVPPFFTPPHLDDLLPQAPPSPADAPPNPTRKHSIQVFYSNISEWGPQARSYIMDSTKPYYKADLHLLIEHHTMDISILRSAFSQIKRGLFSNPPGPSKRSTDGTHGGS